MFDEMISVIVPVYNTETYLRKCIDSILDQTYTNLQIILVDDGSTDRSPDICDEYALKDKRIEVVHKENGGVASARNMGLALIKGAYVGWVDSDDWIEPSYFEELFRNLMSCNADMAIDMHSENPRYHSIKVYKDDILKEYLMGNLSFGLPATLCKREYYDGKKFGHYLLGEDSVMLAEIYVEISIVVRFHTEGYHCLIRNESASHTQKLENKFSGVASTENLIEKIIQAHPELYPYCSYRRIIAASTVYHTTKHALRRGERRKLYKKLRKIIRQALRGIPFFELELYQKKEILSAVKFLMHF